MILSERFLHSKLSLYGVINSVVTKKKNKKKNQKYILNTTLGHVIWRSSRA